VIRPSDIIALRSLTPKRARTEVSALLAQGYKVTWITTHKGGLVQKHAFDVILTNHSRVDTRVFIDLTAAQLNDTIVEMGHEGFSISTLADRERGSAANTVVSYTALFRPTNHLLETEVYLADSMAVFTRRLADKTDAGYRLISQSLVDFRGVEQVSTVFTIDRRLAHNITVDPPPSLVVLTNLTFFQFTGKTLEYARKNYYLSHLEVHERTGDPSARFSIILLAHNDRTIGGGNWFRWALDDESVTTRISSEAANWDPYVVSGYSHQGVLVFYVAFVRHIK